MEIFGHFCLDNGLVFVLIHHSGGLVLLCWCFVKLFMFIKRKPQSSCHVIPAPNNTKAQMTVPGQLQAVRRCLLFLGLPLSPGQMESASGL